MRSPTTRTALSALALLLAGHALAGCADCRNLPTPILDIEVTVRDQATNAPITDATVSFSRAGGAVQTAPHAGNGRYYVPTAAPSERPAVGAYLFTVAHAGYATEMVMGSMPEGQCTSGDQLSVALRPTPTNP